MKTTCEIKAYDAVDDRLRPLDDKLVVCSSERAAFVVLSIGTLAFTVDARDLAAAIKKCAEAA